MITDDYWLRLVIKGDYGQLLAFIARLENNWLVIGSYGDNELVIDNYDDDWLVTTDYKQKIGFGDLCLFTVYG